MAVALSLALVGPILAMAGNGQGIVGLNHADSVYALVGVVIGP